VRRLGAAAVAAVLGASLASALEPSDVAYTYGVGTFVPAYAPPAPGTYELPPIRTLVDHAVLDEDGRETTLRALTSGRLAVVAFVYTTCVEAAGCPVSLSVLQRLDHAIADDAELRGAVTLVAASFDPERDTPARMTAARARHAPAGDWRFVTTRDAAMLAPLLADFGQDAAKLLAADGSWTGLFRHVLKVFLVDRDARVRNIYSVGFIHAELVLNDLRTVLRADAAQVRSDVRSDPVP
jgi:cytochrome c peroxidase